MAVIMETFIYIVRHGEFEELKVRVFSNEENRLLITNYYHY